MRAGRTLTIYSKSLGHGSEKIAAYAKSKTSALWMWTLAMTLDRQLEEALKMFSELNVAVVMMTDFMDRDDQKMVNFYSGSRKQLRVTK